MKKQCNNIYIFKSELVANPCFTWIFDDIEICSFASHIDHTVQLCFLEGWGGVTAVRVLLQLVGQLQYLDCSW